VHGWCILAKRLDRGRFRRPRLEEGQFCSESEPQVLMRFLDDIDFSRRARKQQPQAQAQLVLVQDSLQ
jgi:hypothetical protein